MANCVELSLQGQLIERLESKAREDLDASVELTERSRKGARFVLVGSLDRSGILDSTL